jgi:hypothetical protein
MERINKDEFKKSSPQMKSKPLPSPTPITGDVADK